MAKRKQRIGTIAGFAIYKKAERNGYSLECGLTRISLSEEKPGFWRGSLPSSTPLLRRRFGIKADNLESAAIEAIRRHRLTGGSEVPSNVTDIFQAWYSQLSCRRETGEEYSRKFRLFLAWLALQGITQWGDLKPSHLQKYANELAGGGLKANSVRLRVFPVKAASAWAHKEYGFDDFAKSYKPPKSLFHKIEDPSQAAMTLEEVGDFLLWLRRIGTEESLGVLPGVALQGLCAARLTEVVRLRWEDVRLERGTVRIEGEVKNPFSAREIPLPALAKMILGGEGVAESGPLLPRYSGRHAAGSYGRAVKGLLGEWGRTMVAADLRDSLQTQADLENFAGYALDRYVGHAPRTIRERHYDKPDGEALIKKMRVLIVARIDRATREIVERWTEGDNVVKLKVQGGDHT